MSDQCPDLYGPLVSDASCSLYQTRWDFAIKAPARRITRRAVGPHVRAKCQTPPALVAQVRPPARGLERADHRFNRGQGPSAPHPPGPAAFDGRRQGLTFNLGRRPGREMLRTHFLPARAA